MERAVERPHDCPVILRVVSELIAQAIEGRLDVR